MKNIVRYLSTETPSRNAMNSASLDAAREYIKGYFDPFHYKVVMQTFSCGVGKKQVRVSNVIAKHQKNSPDKKRTIVIGAHYDSVEGAGADDNASGVAAVLALAELLDTQDSIFNIELVFFVNAEPLLCTCDGRGSMVYAKNLRQNTISLHCSLILDRIGCFSGRAGSPRSPKRLRGSFPAAGDFLFGWADPDSEQCLAKLKADMNTSGAPFLSISRLLPDKAETIMKPVVHSDSWAFWKYRYPSVLLTGTAFYKNDNYCISDDTCETLNYEMMGRIVLGFQKYIIVAQGGHKKESQMK